MHLKWTEIWNGISLCSICIISNFRYTHIHTQASSAHSNQKLAESATSRLHCGFDDIGNDIAPVWGKRKGRGGCGAGSGY